MDVSMFMLRVGITVLLVLSDHYWRCSRYGAGRKRSKVG